MEILPEDTPFNLSSSTLSAHFSSSGLLTGVTHREDGSHTTARVEFIQYRAKVDRPKEDTSGAYLFIPGIDRAKGISNSKFLDGEGTLRKITNPQVFVVEGSLKSSVIMQKSWIKHSVVLLNSPGVYGTGIQVSLYCLSRQ